MAGVQLLAVPYDSGRRGERLGRGPDALLAGGAAGQCRAAAAERVEVEEPFPTEVGTSFALVRRLAGRVRAAADAGALPVVLAGNCFTAVGTLAGLDDPGVGVVWFDCHGDFQTPETTPSGFLDGMALATAAGRCWPSLTATVPGFRPLPAGHVLHLGGRDFDPGEREAMEQAGVAVVDAAALARGGVGPALARLSNSWKSVYIHIDLDVLDPGEAPVNGYQKPGGLAVAQVEEAVRLIRGRWPARAAALTAYDPGCDPEGRAVAAGLRLLRGLVGP